MSIQEYAQAILTANTIEEKLLPYVAGAYPEGGVNDTQHLAQQRGLVTGRRTAVKCPFPDDAKLVDGQQRAIVLHYFANHELIAIDLYAWALLKFSWSSGIFQRQLLATLQEEQQHLRLYLKRMQEFGLHFGDVDHNDSFWQILTATEHPLNFMAGISLTLEQANLDFAGYYEQQFVAVDDRRSAAIMRTILNDEIKHVARGVRAVARWGEPKESQWELYKRVLPAPLTPRRARGHQFNAQARKQAGLTDDFIENVRLYEHSRGRQGRLLWFAPSAELWLNRQGRQPPMAKQVRQLWQDWSSLMMLVAKQDDAVVVSSLPCAQWQRTMSELGFQLPQWVVAEDVDDLMAKVGKQKFSQLEPWSWCPKMRESAERLFQRGVLKQSAPAWSNADLFSKAWHTQLRHDFLREHQLAEHASPEKTELCLSEEEVLAQIERLHAHGFVALTKGLFGISGREQLRLDCDDRLTDSNRGWICRQLKQHGQLLVEPYRSRLIDFGVVIDTRNSKRQWLCGINWYLADDRGQVQAIELGMSVRSLPAAHRRALTFGDRWSKPGAFFQALAQYVGRALINKGYTGPASVDCFLWGKSDQPIVQPIVEINPRYSLGYFALAAKKTCPDATQWVATNAQDVHGQPLNDPEGAQMVIDLRY